MSAKSPWEPAAAAAGGGRGGTDDTGAQCQDVSPAAHMLDAAGRSGSYRGAPAGTPALSGAPPAPPHALQLQDLRKIVLLLLHLR